MKRNTKTAPILLVLLASLSLYSQDIVRKGFFNFTPVAIDSSTQKAHNIKVKDGVLITEIKDNCTLKSLKAKENDVLISVNENPITSLQDYNAVKNSFRFGDQITISVLRHGRLKKLKGKVSEKPYETSLHSEVIYDQFNFKNGQIRTIINKPKATGKHPVIFFIPGYNCISLDNLKSYHPYRKLVDGFVEKGYAVFRVEKPGMGDNVNTGKCEQLGFDNELTSYLKGYDQLKKYDFVDLDNVFIWGHSMGGLYAPIIASKKQPKGLAFYGMIHDTWIEYLLRMVRYQNPWSGYTDYVQTDKDVRNLYALLYEQYILKKPAKVIAKNPVFDKILRRSFWFDGENQIFQRHEKFWIELYEHSLTEYVSKFNGFVLSMNGEADIQVINDFSQREVVKIVNTYHPNKGEFVFFPKTDHAMIKVGTMEDGIKISRDRTKYRQLMQDSFNYDVVNKTHNWIQEKLSLKVEN